jgi:ABC-type uncharacterized transport system involved in gliding motility auxiliary subunit
MRLLERVHNFVARYAPQGATIGGVAVVGALGAGLVLGQMKTWMWILGGVGLALLVAIVLLRPGGIVSLLRRRQARYGGNAVLMSVAFIAILVLANYLGARHHWRWDVTAEKQFSLSEQSIQVLQELTEPVQVKLFFTPANASLQEAEDLLKEYTQRSDKVTYEVIDPDTQRRIALDYQISRDGTIVFERGKRREFAFGTQEQDLTSALLKASRDEIKGVYFLTGHQERSPESTEATGYSLIKEVMERENYRVATYNLAVTDTWPTDMAVLVVAGPQRALATEETARLAQFVDQGGSLLVMVEPGMADPLNGFLHAYGLDLPDDVVIDPSKSFFGDVGSPVADKYAYHQITKDMNGLTSVFAMARSLAQTEPAPSGWTVQMLAETSADSWAETSYREPDVKPGADESRGPLGLVAAIEPSTEGTGKGRLVVIGDATLVGDDLLGSVSGNIGNIDLFMNSIGWLAEDEALISIRPKEVEERSVVLTAPQARGVIYSSILFVPLVVLAAGILVWWRRR